MGPTHTRRAMVALRNHKALEWASFHPKALRIGDVADVLRQQCFPRLLSPLLNLIFGMPLIG